MKIMELITPSGQEIYKDTFGDLNNWHHEGIGRVEIIKPGTMRLDCSGSRQGREGCHAFCIYDFPDNICIEYDLTMQSSNGLLITFMAMQGLQGGDIITELPVRSGIFSDYVGTDAKMRSYHVSVSRYDDNGIHSGVSNWRRNPGLVLVGQGPDLCEDIQKTYKIRIIKKGIHCQLGVNGNLAHEFFDEKVNINELPTIGKVGFRAIGSKVIADIQNFKVTKC